MCLLREVDMKRKYVVYVALILVLAGVIFGATKLYNVLSEQYGFVMEGDFSQEKASDEIIKGDTENIVATDEENKTDEHGKEEERKEASNKAVDFTVYDKDGEEIRLSSMFGKPIVLNFWATWCGPCKKELPAFDEMYAKYKDDVHFMMINVTDGESQTREIVDKFIAENEYGFPVYYDETLMASYIYGANSIPLTVIVRQDGTLYGGRVGAMNKNELEYYIKDVLRSDMNEDNS